MKSVKYCTLLGVAALLLTLSSCQYDRFICSYVAHNKMATERAKGTADTLRAPEIYHYYDRDNRSYFEMGMFYHNGQAKLILANDLFNSIVRYHFFQESQRAGLIYDKYERVHYVALDNADVTDFLNFYKKLQQPLKKSQGAVFIDYTFGKDAFVTITTTTSFPEKTGLYVPKVTGMALWINGRRTDLNVEEFMWKMQSLVW